MGMIRLSVVSVPLLRHTAAPNSWWARCRAPLSRPEPVGTAAKSPARRPCAGRPPATGTPTATRSRATWSITRDSRNRPNRFPCRRARSSPAFVRSMRRVRFCRGPAQDGDQERPDRPGGVEPALVNREHLHAEPVEFEHGLDGAGPSSGGVGRAPRPATACTRPARTSTSVRSSTGRALAADSDLLVDDPLEHARCAHRRHFGGGGGGTRGGRDGGAMRAFRLARRRLNSHSRNRRRCAATIVLRRGLEWY